MALRMARQEMARRGQADRRNGGYSRWLLTELGRIELSVPRTRHFSPHPVVRAYARRTDHIDRMVLACFVLGLSSRKLAKALLPVLGTPVSASTVSRVTKTLDAAVAAFHARPLPVPASNLIAEAGVIAPHMIGRRADGTRQQVVDALLQDRVGRETVSVGESSASRNS